MFTTYMLDLLKKPGKLYIFPLFALGFFFGAYFFFYRDVGGYSPPELVEIAFEEIEPLASGHSRVVEIPLLLIEDAQAAQEFTPGSDPEYGTFSWIELAGPEPILVTARYFFKSEEGAVPGCDVNQQTEPGTVLRQLTRGGELIPPIVILNGILVFCEVEFQVEDPIWAFDSETKSWTYTEGQVTVIINRHLEAGAAILEGTSFGEQTFVQKLVADFRPQGIRPVPPPPPS